MDQKMSLEKNENKKKLAFLITRKGNVLLMFTLRLLTIHIFSSMNCLLISFIFLPLLPLPSPPLLSAGLLNSRY